MMKENNQEERNMSFFKDLKDDVSQAMSELEEDQIETTDLLPEEKVQEEMIAQTTDSDIDTELMNSILEEPEIEKKKVTEAKDDLENTEESITIITKGTTINGSIISDSSLEVMGTINGDIECIGKLTITGQVVGNSVASEIYVNTKRLEGNLDSEGSVKIGLGTVIIGDIKAGSAVIAGAVKGEVDIKGPVVMDSTAIVKGNVKAKAVQMNNGAVLEGFCSLSYSSVDIENVFD